MAKRCKQYPITKPSQKSTFLTNQDNRSFDPSRQQSRAIWPKSAASRKLSSFAWAARTGAPSSSGRWKGHLCKLGQQMNTWRMYDMQHCNMSKTNRFYTSSWYFLSLMLANTGDQRRSSTRLTSSARPAASPASKAFGKAWMCLWHGSNGFSFPKGYLK